MMATEGGRLPCRGRDGQLDLLAGAVRQASAGRFGGVIVEGEPGIGKSRLLAEAFDRARDQGCAIAVGRAEELERSRPFGVLAEAFGCVPSSADPRRAAIADLLAPRVGQLGPITVTSDPGLQFQVVDHLVDLVEELALSRPLVVGVDDLQWADPATVLTLDAMARHLTYAPVALLLGLRPAGSGPQIERLIATLGRVGLQRLSLGPLDEPSVIELVTDAAGAAPGPGLLAEISGAAGNPFFVLELVQTLRDAGAVQVTNGHAEATEPGLPPSLRLTILQRLSFLDGHSVDLLRTAAVLGTRFALTDLSTVVSRSAVDVASSLQAAFAAGVLIDDGAYVRFQHDLVRAAIYTDLPQSMRVALHREAGQRLAVAGAPATRVAQQLSRAAEPGDPVAIEWLTRSAREAAMSSPGIAADLLEQVVELTSPTDPGYDVLLAERAGHLLWTGRIPEAAAIGRALRDRHVDPEVEASVHAMLGRCLMADGRMDEALTELERSYRAPRATAAQRAVSWGSASTAQVFAGRLDAASAAADQARAAADEAGDLSAVSMAMTAHATLELFRGRLHDALRLVEDAIRCADASAGRKGHRYVHHLVRGHVLTELDRLPEARAALETGMRLSEERGMRWSLGAYQLMLGLERFAVGDWDEALGEIGAGLELSEETGERYNIVLGHCLLALIALHRNDLAGADMAVTAASEELAQRGPRYRSHWIPWIQGLLSEARGANADAYRTLAACWDSLVGAGTALEYATVAPDLIRLALVAGDRRRAADAVEAVEAVAAANDAPSLTGAALRCRGLYDNDGTTLRKAVDAYARSPRPLEHALSCEDAATALGRSGDQKTAGELLTRALTTYERLEAARDAARATSVLRGFGVRRGPRGPTSRARTGWDSLTPSERTVVQLVAEGLSNPQIGERLFVSRRTAQTHLGHVFQKLQIGSRSELAAAVARRQPHP